MVTSVTSVWYKIVATSVVTAVALVSGGCGKLLETRADEDAGAAPGAKLGPRDLGDEALQAKLDAYVTCLNSLSLPIHKARSRYLTYVPKAGPTGRESFADVMKLPADTAAKCADGVARAASMPPANAELEAAGAEYARAASELERLLIDASPYYEAKGYRDDTWAKGKVMHPRLMNAWARFSTADTRLHDMLEGLTRPLSERVLTRIERVHGKEFRYGRKKVLLTSRKLIEASHPVGGDDDIPFTLYGQAYTDFASALGELVAYGSAHRAELDSQQLAPSWPSAGAHYERFVKEATELDTAASAFWRCLHEAPAKAKSPSGKVDMQKMGNCADGPAWKQGDAVIERYNAFIRTSNAHPFP